MKMIPQKYLHVYFTYSFNSWYFYFLIYTIIKKVDCSACKNIVFEILEEISVLGSPELNKCFLFYKMSV